MTEQQPTAENRPAFDGGAFIINYLSPSTKGFEIQTRERLLRHTPGELLPEGKRIAEERKKDSIASRVGTIYPQRGESLDGVRDRILARTRPDGSPEVKPQDIIIEGDHIRFIPGFTPIVGARNFFQEGNKLSIDVMPVTFPTYRAINSPEERPDALHMANPGATASILLTTEGDGSHKIIMQHRSPKNYFYGDVPGASIAGYLDAYLDREPINRGKIHVVDTDSIKQNNLKEMDEELGLAPEDISEVKITGVATDKIKHHTEFLLSGVSKLSTEQIAQKVEARAKEKRPNDTFDFEGNFVVLDGTPEAIESLLTRVRCPVVPTHAAAFVAAGYSFLLERAGLEAANQWRDKMQQDVAENYRQINAMVVSYWAKHVDAAEQHPVNKPPHNIFGYDPAYSPVEQGLPSLEAELIRVGLTKKED